MATKRGYYREELLRATQNIEMSLTHIVRVAQGYEELHPDIADKVKECGDALAKIGEILLSIRDAI